MPESKRMRDNAAREKKIEIHIRTSEIKSKWNKRVPAGVSRQQTAIPAYAHYFLMNIDASKKQRERP